MKHTGLIYLVFVLVLLSSGQINAQEDPEIDSLTTLLETLQGEERLEILFLLTENPSLSIDDRQDYAKDAISLASDLSNTELLVEAHIKNGFIFYEIDEFDDAIESFETAYAISEESNYAKGRANALNRIGGVNRWIGNYDIALDYFNRSLEIGKKAKDPQIEAEALYLIADIKRRNAQYAEAIEYLDRARPVAEVSNNQELLADIIGDYGFIMYLQGNFQESIKKYEQAAILYSETGQKFDAARMYVRIGTASTERGEYDIALNNFQKALPIFEEIKSYEGISAVTNNMGVIYFTQELYDQALEVHFSHLEKSRAVGDKPQIANALNNIGNCYNKIAEDSLQSLFGENYQDSVKIEPTDKYLKLFDEALRYYEEAIEVQEEIGDRHGTSLPTMNIGIIYVSSGKPAMALEPLQRALELNAELNDKANQARIYLLLGQVYLAFDNYPTSLDYLNNALELALETDTREITMNIYQKLSFVYQKQKKYVLALKYYKLYFASYESIFLEKRQEAIADMQVKYETDATEKENALLLAESELQEAKISRTRTILAITIIAIGVFIVMMIQLIRQNNLKKKANRELALKNDLITEQKKEITDSIQYASRIQSAMLPPGDYVDSLMPERFIIYMPRDIVSGDYYYITEKDGRIICVAADCTGHGVPGAFMSMLGIAFLNEIIRKHTELHTDQILGELRNHVITSLHQTGKEGESQDGMDVALFILDPRSRKMEFSGANNSLLVYRNGDLIEAKADKMPIGIHTRYKEPFTRHNLDLQKGDMVYTFSDGYPDQFGGPDQKKFMIKKFKKMLHDIHMKSTEEQQKIMQQTLNDWMAETEQIDDILVIGVMI